MKATKSVIGFSLIEVVVAVGILGAGLATIMGYATPIAGRIRLNRETMTCAAVATSLEAYLQTQTFASIAALLDRPADLFADRSGTTVAPGADPVWSGANEKYFAISLVRRSGQTPVEEDATGAWLAFDVHVASPLRQMDYSSSFRR